MPRKKSEKSKRAANGQGSIKQRTVTRNGKNYTYWSARCYIPDPETGILELKEFTASTQDEAVKKMKDVQFQIKAGTYHKSAIDYTLAQWLDVWAENYLANVKPYTQESYRGHIRNHFKPSKISKVKLSQLSSLQIQRLYNSLVNATNGEALSPKTIKNAHGCLHKALQVAVNIGLIRNNPADNVSLPKVTKKEFAPLADDEIAEFIKAVNGSPYRLIMLVTLFTGMRQSEVIGLTWDNIDFKAGTIKISHQLQYIKSGGGVYMLTPTKNSQTRVIRPAPSVMKWLDEQKTIQFSQRSEYGTTWQNDLNLVFTQPTGKHFTQMTIYKHFKELATSIGRPDARFHDLRHSFAVQSLRNGDDIRTVQTNLGHATASFTLQTYLHTTVSMQQESANRMESFIQAQKEKTS